MKILYWNTPLKGYFKVCLKVYKPRAYYTEWSQKEKYKCHILIHIYTIKKESTDEFICKAAMETQT